MKTIHVRVEGRVQGVFFRDCTRTEARRLGVTGWIRNLSDGSVETVIQGEPDDLDAMLTWLRQGSPNASVTHLRQQTITDSETFSGFTIRY